MWVEPQNPLHRMALFWLRLCTHECPVHSLAEGRPGFSHCAIKEELPFGAGKPWTACCLFSGLRSHLKKSDDNSCFLGLFGDGLFHWRRLGYILAHGRSSLISLFQSNKDSLSPYWVPDTFPGTRETVEGKLDKVSVSMGLTCQARKKYQRQRNT